LAKLYQAPPLSSTKKNQALP